MSNTTSSQKPKLPDKNTGGKPKKNPRKKPQTSRQALYHMVAAHVPQAIAVAVEIMNSGDADSARLGAAKLILNKAIPDLKATEITTGEDGKLQIVLDFGKNGIKTNPIQKTSKVSK